MKKEKIYAITSIVVFMAVLVLPSFLWLFISIVLPGYQEKLDYDLGENRNKAAFPETFNAAYMQEVEKYYNDRLPFRSVIISANRKVDFLMEETYDAFVMPYLVKLVRKDTGETVNSDGAAQAGDRQEALSETATDKKQADSIKAMDEEEMFSAKDNAGEEQEMSAETTEGTETDENSVGEAENETLDNEGDDYLMPKIHNDTVIEGRDKWLFFMLENSLEDYQGSNVFSQEQMEEYVADMQALKQCCDAAGKSLFFLIPPNKEQVYSEKMPDITVYDSYKREQRLVDYIHANTDLKVAYPLPELLAAKEKYQVYYRTDTHWSVAGAFVGVQSLYSLMGMPVTGLGSVNVESFDVSAPDIGDLIGLGNLSAAEYGGDINYSIDYKPSEYAVGVAGSDPGANFYSSVSPSGQPCNLVVVGDSFRIYAGLFMQKDFSSCTLIKYKNPGDLYNTDAANAIRTADCIVVLLVERNYMFMPGITSEMQSILKEK